MTLKIVCGARWIIVTCVAMLAFGCAEEPDVNVEALVQENADLKKKVAEQDSIVTRIGAGAKFVNAYLDSLDQLESSIKRDLADQEQDSIIVDKVKAVTQLVSLNRHIVEDLRKSLGEDNLAAQLFLVC